MSPIRAAIAESDQAVIFDRRLKHRLRRAEGQVRAVQRMLDERQPCEEIVTQLLAARSALDQVIREILSHRVAECLATLPPDQAQTAISRAVALLVRAWQVWEGPMPFLSEADQDQLKDIFSNQLQQRVRLRVLTKPTSKLYIPGQQLCATCSEAEPFVRELAALSDKLEVVVHDVQAEPAVAEQYGVDGALPVILIEAVPTAEAGESPGSGAIRFLGLPAGYEFSTFVADIVDFSTGVVGLSQATQDELRDLDQDLHLQVFVTPT